MITKGEESRRKIHVHNKVSSLFKGLINIFKEEKRDEFVPYFPIEPGSPSWDKKYYSKWSESLTPNEINAIKEYTLSGYDDLNSYLRYKDKFIENFKPSEVEIDKIIQRDKNLESALSKAEVPHNMTVYRGVDEFAIRGLINDPLFDKDTSIETLQGKEMNDKGYMSTTFDYEKAKKFCLYGRVILKINVPKGANGASIGDLSSTVGESEMLFMKNCKMKITRARQVNGYKVLICDMIK